MTAPADVPASPLCRAGISTYLRHDLGRDGVCARCGWAVPGLVDERRGMLADHHGAEPAAESLAQEFGVDKAGLITMAKAL